MGYKKGPWKKTEDILRHYFFFSLMEIPVVKEVWKLMVGTKSEKGFLNDS